MSNLDTLALALSLNTALSKFHEMPYMSMSDMEETAENPQELYDICCILINDIALYSQEIKRRPYDTLRAYFILDSLQSVANCTEAKYNYTPDELANMASNINKLELLLEMYITIINMLIKATLKERI